MGKANRSEPPRPPRAMGRKRLCDKAFCPTEVLSERRGTIAENGCRKTRGQAPPGAETQRPAKPGFRFSRKARMPSLMSSVEASSPNNTDSNS